MAEDLVLSTATQKCEIYRSLKPQLAALLNSQDNLTGCMANFCAAPKEQFGWLWVGFYILKQGKLQLGPFQGPIACMEIEIGRGVCGRSYQLEKALIVPDVSLFEDHISCSSKSNSELVIPFKGTTVSGVVDIDSETKAAFDEDDLRGLTDLLGILRL